MELQKKLNMFVYFGKPPLRDIPLMYLVNFFSVLKFIYLINLKKKVKQTQRNSKHVKIMHA